MLTLFDLLAVGTPGTSNAKRSLNRSVDTPRIIKHIKESKTPSHPRDSFLPIFQSTIVQDSSEEEDSDVIEVSSEDEIPRKTIQSHANKTVRQTTIDSHFKPPRVVTPSSETVKQEITSPETIEVRLKSWLENANRFILLLELLSNVNYNFI